MRYLWLLLSVISLNVMAQEWNFNVTLDGKEIGSHRFALESHGDQKTLKSEARFNVKILFINAYRYHHLADEVWQGDCLQNLNAITEENGTETKIKGKQDTGLFVLEGTKGTENLSACTMTFAYWNPKILEQKKLLNPQTGDYLDAKISLVGTETINVHGNSVQAKHHKIDTSKFKIDLWYSPEGDWLALQSTTPEGRKVYYTLK